MMPLLLRAQHLAGLVFANALGTVVAQVAQVIAIPIQLRSLGAEQYGMMALFLSFVAVGSVVDAGISSTSLRFVARSRDRPKLLRHVLASSLTVILMISALFLLGGQAVAALIVALSGKSSIGGMDLPLLTALVTTGVATTILLSFGLGILRGLRSYRLFSICETSARLLLVIAVTATAAFTGEVLYVIISYTAVTGLAALAVLGVALREARAPFRLTTNLHYFRRHMANFSKWIWLQSVVGYLGAQADRFVVAAFMNLETLSMYSIAMSLATALSVASNAAAGFLLPEAAARLRQREWLAASFIRLTFLLSAATSVIVLAFSPFADPLLTLWLGPPYGSSVALFLVPLLWVVSSTVTSIPGTQLAVAMGHVRLTAIAGLIGNGIVLTGIVLGGWWFGTMGVVGAKLLALPLGFSIRAVIAAKVFKLRPPILVALKVTWPTLAGAAVGLSLFGTLFR